MSLKKTKIMVFGTFDFLHKGHLNFFRQARELAKHPFLIVSVARDANVNKIKDRAPFNSQNRRLSNIKKISLVDKVVLGGLKNHIPHIIKENPEIIALGYDQSAYVKGLKTLLFNRGLKVKVARLKPYKPKIYKSSLIAPKI